MLKAEVSIPAALATAAVVYTVYNQATPSIADIRSAPQADDHIEASRKSAAWISAAVVGGISLLAKDPTIFVVGGAMVIAMDWWTRHANQVNPMTGKASTVPVGMSPMDTGDVTVEFAEGAGTY